MEGSVRPTPPPSPRVAVPGAPNSIQVRSDSPSAPQIADRVLAYVRTQGHTLPAGAGEALTAAIGDGTLRQDEFNQALGLTEDSPIAAQAWTMYTVETSGIRPSQDTPPQSREDAIREVIAFAADQQPRIVFPQDARDRLIEAFADGECDRGEFNRALNLHPPMTEAAWLAFTGGSRVVREPQHLARYCRTFTEFNSVTGISFLVFCDWDEVTIIPRDRLTSFMYNMSREQLLQLVRQHRRFVESAVSRYLQLPQRGLLSVEQYYDAVAETLERAQRASGGISVQSERMREMFALLGYGVLSGMSSEAENAGVDFHDLPLRDDPLLATAFLQGPFASFTQGDRSVITDERCEELERLSRQLTTLRSQFAEPNPEIVLANGQRVHLNDLDPTSQRFRDVLTYMEGSEFRALTTPEARREALLAQLRQCPPMPVRQEPVVQPRELNPIPVTPVAVVDAPPVVAQDQPQASPSVDAGVH
jgi:hypothetical protein